MLSQEQQDIINAEREKIEEIKSDIKESMNQAYELMKDKILFDAEIDIIRNGSYTFSIDKYKDEILSILGLQGENADICIGTITWSMNLHGGRAPIFAYMHFPETYNGSIKKAYDFQSWYYKIRDYLNKNELFESHTTDTNQIIFKKFNSTKHDVKEPQALPYKHQTIEPEDCNNNTSPYFIVFIGLALLFGIFLICLATQG